MGPFLCTQIAHSQYKKFLTCCSLLASSADSLLMGMLCTGPRLQMVKRVTISSDGSNSPSPVVRQVWLTGKITA